MVTIAIKKLNELAKIPTRGSDSAAGYDLYSTEEYTLKPLERKLFKTGISVAIPLGLYGRVAPRSGLAYKDGLDVMAGVIDSDYRGDVGVILINLGNVDKKILMGDKIAQMIFEHYNDASFLETDDLSKTIRAEKGFGSTDTTKGTLTALGTILDAIPVKSTLADAYQKVGGIPVKKRYSDEIKERDGK